MRQILRATEGAAALADRTLTYDSFDPAEEPLREALTSTGNGYFCTRGAAEWEAISDVHYPGTYAHGVYNRETSILRTPRAQRGSVCAAELARPEAAGR